MGQEITRRELFKLAGGGAVAWGLGKLGLNGDSAAEAAQQPLLVVARNQSPAAMVRAVFKGLGGIGKFLKPGGVVVIKPNAAWQRRPEQAGNTNPEVAAEVVRICKEGGAKIVKVIDHPVAKPASISFKTNGLKTAVERAGAIMIDGSSRSLYRPLRIPRGRVLKSSHVLKDVMDADLFINLPIAKVHNAIPYTIGFKNLMGVTLDRGAFHNSPDLGQAIVDYATEVRPHLTIVDAVRALLTNGPQGPGKIKDANMLIAGTDPLAVDAYTVRHVFDQNPEKVAYLRYASRSGLGELDLKKVTVKDV